MLIDTAAIMEQFRKDTERVRALGITEEEERLYYNSLPIEWGDDPEREQEVFQKLVSRKNLSDDEKLFVKAHLDKGDGR